MELTVSQEQARVPVTVFHVKGDLTADTSDQLDQAARQAYDAGARYFVLDLAGVGYISSYGIRSISEILYMLRAGAAGNQDTEMSSAIRSGKQKSQHLKLAATPAQVQKVLATAGVDMFLDMYRDVKTALDSF
jgi:anti-anti-sigma factor